jgi:hypothetical protein
MGLAELGTVSLKRVTFGLGIDCNTGIWVSSVELSPFFQWEILSALVITNVCCCF